MKSLILTKQNKKNLFFDSYGKYEYSKVIYNIFVLFIFTNLYQFVYLIFNKVIYFNIKNIDNLHLQYLFYSKKFYINFFNYDFLSAKVQLFIVPLYIVFVYILLSIYMYRKSLLAVILNKLSLEDYKITKYKKKELIILKSKKYEEHDYDFVAKQKDDIVQLFKFDTNVNTLITRYKHNKIKIEKEKQFRKILNFDIAKLQKNKFYLGQKIINNDKITDDYIDYTALLHTAILGTSGGGKSVFLNHLIINIFYNFEVLDNFYFIDFKGGLEAKTYDNIKQKMGLNNITTCDNNLQKLHQVLTNIYNINQKRMQILKDKNLKKWKDEYIFLIFDEFAQVFQYAPKNADEKKMLAECVNIIENLFSTCRSQNIRIIYSTQSYVKEASGVTNAIKVNTGVKFMFNTKAQTSIQSVVSPDVLKEYQLNPKVLKKGEALILDVEDIDSHRFKTPYSEDLENILIDILKND